MLATATVLMALAVYWEFCSVTWDETDRHRLESESLHLAHILWLLDAPDVRWLMGRPSSRREIVREFSGYLRDDVVSLLRRERKSLALLLWASVFFFSYYVMRIKGMASSGTRDLRFLSGLELTIFRSVDWKRSRMERLR